MNHEKTLTMLDEYADGTLPADARREVEAHLAECASCRAELAAIQALLAEVGGLPKSIQPEHELWDGIAARIAPRGRAGRRPWLLALAAILLMALSSAMTAWWLGRQAPASDFAQVQARYAEESAELARRVLEGPSELSPQTLAAVARHLRIIDEAIQEAEAALREDPANRALEQMLFVRYQQRLELLRQADRAAGEES